MKDKSVFKCFIRPTHEGFQPDMDCAFFVNGMRTRNFLADFIPAKNVWLIYLPGVPKTASVEIRRPGILLNNNVIPHTQIKDPPPGTL